ncbi:MAG: cation:proton antiporter [Pseudomonadota bacterium]
MGHIPLLSEIVVVAVVAVVVVLVLARLRLPTVLGLILAGTVVGPGGLSLVDDLHNIEALAEVGVVLLLFTVGLEFSLRRLRPIARLIVAGGTLQVGASIALAVGVSQLLGATTNQGVFLGFLVALSSTAIVLRTLADRGELQAPHGSFIVGVLIFQDLCVVPMVLITPLLTTGSGADIGLPLALALGKAVAIVAVALLVVRPLVPRVLAIVDARRSRDIFLLAVLSLCAGVAWLTSLAGLSLALGAFLAGLVLADTDFRERALGDVLPLRDVFTSLFFVSLGMLFDPRVLFDKPLFVGLLLLGFVGGKGLIGMVAALVMRLPSRVAWLAGVGLAQFSEFGFVLVKLGEQSQTIDAQTSQVIIAAGVLSMLATPLLIRSAPHITAGEALLRPLARLLGARSIDEPAAEHVALQDHVVIVGFGVAGRLLARALHQVEVPYLILELNAETVRRARAAGEPAYYADISSVEALDHARVQHARALVLLLKDTGAALRTISLMRDHAPGIPVLVRTPYLASVPELLAAGAADVVSEELSAGVAILRRLPAHLPQNSLATRVLSHMRVVSVTIAGGDWAAGRRPEILPLGATAQVLAVAARDQVSYVNQVDPREALHAGDVVFVTCEDKEADHITQAIRTGPAPR